MRLVNFCQRPRIYAGLELEFLSAETVAKFILKVHCITIVHKVFFSPELLLKDVPLLIFSTSAKLA
jgi:hypothetical protein